MAATSDEWGGLAKRILKSELSPRRSRSTKTWQSA